MADVRVGTSGWSYPAWAGPFYPEGTPPARMLGVYATELTAVEAHATYRRLPTSQALTRWREQVPPGFRFAPKAHMGITHRRDLDGVEDRVAAFLAAVAPLGDQLGPVLLSLPHVEPDLGRLDRILAALPPPALGPTAAFDLAPPWSVPAVLDRLDAAGATLVVSDTERHPAAALPAVGPVAYLRLRRDAYADDELAVWAGRLGAAAAGGRDAYAFLKHDDAANGPRWAVRLLAACRDRVPG
jgi:uncharacterized protein YecE (DUF72 family)